MNQRDFHLSFCSDCINRKMDINKGIVCKLSNKRAEFENNCDDYEVDLKLRIQLIKTLKKEIEFSYTTNSMAFTLGGAVFEQFNVSKFESLPKNKKNQSRPFGILMLCTCLFFVIIIFAQNIKNPPDNYWNSLLVYLIICGIPAIYGIYLIFSKKKYFIWNEHFMQLKKSRVYYRDILFFGRSYSFTGSGTGSNKIVIGTKSKGLVTLETYGLGVTTDEIGKLILEKCENLSILENT